MTKSKDQWGAGATGGSNPGGGGGWVHIMYILW